MHFNETTVGEMFQVRDLHLQIPIYQRAYSWIIDQWRVFLEDLTERLSMKNSYSYGSILLEKVGQGQPYEIIDGQQRITTLIIFMRSVINVLREKNSPRDLKTWEQDFIVWKSQPKLSTVDADRACFNALIVQNKDSFTPSSKSQESIKGAKKYFTDELRKLDVKSLRTLVSIVLSASVTRMEMEGKKESALMFELQNNRGRNLTNLEKLKSFFMYHMFVQSPAADIDGNVNQVSDYFKSIYTNIYALGAIDEDSMLRYHCFAYLSKAFAYRNLDDIVEEYKSSGNKVQWIKDFLYELTQSFSNVKELSKTKDPYLDKLKDYAIPPFAYAFIIKGLKHFKDDRLKMGKLYKLMEAVTFRVKVIGSRADFNSRMSDLIRGFNGDVDQLAIDMATKLNATPYWTDAMLKQRLEGYMYQHGMLNSILWEYESSLGPKGYVAQKGLIPDESIEHISPQTPTNPNEKIASGYDVDANNNYSQVFQEKYLNCIGNLMLISRSQNSVVGNRKFTDKLASYNSCKLLNQQQEIATFVQKNPTEWKTAQILERRDRIVKFCMKRWAI